MTVLACVAVLVFVIGNGCAIAMLAYHYNTERRKETRP